MEIKTIPISKIKPAVYNPRKDLKPGDPEYDKLKKIINEFGLVDPLVINKDFTLISGHQRLKILKEQGVKQVQVSVVNLNKQKEKALNIALNNPSAQGEWCYPKLKDLIVEIDDGALDMELLGFDELELKDIFDYEGLNVGGNGGGAGSSGKKPLQCPECGYEFPPKKGKEN